MIAVSSTIPVSPLRAMCVRFGWDGLLKPSAECAHPLHQRLTDSKQKKKKMDRGGGEIEQLNVEWDRTRERSCE
jgi:hypothetical protein